MSRHRAVILVRRGVPFVSDSSNRWNGLQVCQGQYGGNRQPRMSLGQESLPYMTTPVPVVISKLVPLPSRHVLYGGCKGVRTSKPQIWQNPFPDVIVWLRSGWVLRTRTC